MTRDGMQREVNNFEAVIKHYEIAAQCAGDWTNSRWIDALYNGNCFDLMSSIDFFINFSGDCYERDCKWLITDDQLYVADLFNCTGCLDSSL